MEYKNLGDRMKGAYENVYRLYLPENFPVIIRLDGSHFHSFTKGMDRPFDKIFIKTMQATLLDLCESIPGCKLGYVQSDEISLLLTNNDTIKTQPWFNNNIQKITSISASICSVAFNHNFLQIISQYEKSLSPAYYAKLNGKAYTAFFDSRVFIIPDYEVNNYFIWRQQDCTRNSILSVAQSLFSAKEIHGINTKALQDKMLIEKDMNWNDYSTVEKRGTCCKRITYTNTDGVIRHRWDLDYEIPIFSQNPDYVNSLLPTFRATHGG